MATTARDIRNKLDDRRIAFSQRREMRRAAREPRKAARRRVLSKLFFVVALIAAFTFLAIMVGDSDYQATPIGWIPLIMLITAIVVSWLYLQLLRFTVKFEETSEVHDCHRDSEITFKASFHNKSILYAFKVEAFFFISDLDGNVANESSIVLALSPRESYELPFAARFEHIGVYQAGLEKIVLSDFLNLFTATIENEKRRRVHVAPRVHTLANMKFSTDAEIESDKALKAILAQSMDYAYVREYEPGDPLKTIHWKLSARSSGYMTKLFEVYTNPGVAIVLDLYGRADRATEYMTMYDCVVECGFTIADYARSQGLDTELYFRDRFGDNRMLKSWRKGELSRLVDEIPAMSDDETLRQAGLEIVESLSGAQRGQNNLVVCTADLSAEMVSAVIASKIHDRTPFMIAVLPPGLPERERQRRCANLSQLDTAGISYKVLSYADELAGGSM